MKANGLALVVALGAAFTVSAAKAESGFYATAELAQSVCGSDEVVYVDLDHGRYYKKGTEAFGKSDNGVYACEKAAHAKYREGKSEPSAVATSK